MTEPYDWEGTADREARHAYQKITKLGTDFMTRWSWRLVALAMTPIIVLATIADIVTSLAKEGWVIIKRESRDGWRMIRDVWREAF